MAMSRSAWLEAFRRWSNRDISPALGNVRSRRRSSPAFAGIRQPLVTRNGRLASANFARGQRSRCRVSGPTAPQHDQLTPLTLRRKSGRGLGSWRCNAQTPKRPLLGHSWRRRSRVIISFCQTIHRVIDDTRSPNVGFLGQGDIILLRWFQIA